MTQKHISMASIVFAILALMPTTTCAQRGRVGPVRYVPRPVPLVTAPRHPVPVSGLRKGVRTNGAVQEIMRSRPSVTPGAAEGFGFGGGYPLSIQDLLNITPNSGFDWQHINAIYADLPIKAFIDPVTQMEVAQAERLLRLTGGAFPSAGGSLYYIPPETQEVASAEQQVPASEPARSQVIVLERQPAAPEQHAVAQTGANEQTADHGGLVLVLRTGRQIQVAAFTLEKDRTVYITAGGRRLSIPTADLDPGATLRVNNEQGTPLQLPF
jgi:hypothetical protein